MSTKTAAEENRNGLRPIQPPVSQRQVIVSGPFDTVIKPVLQSGAVGLAFVQGIVAPLLLCVVAGPVTFWMCAGIVSLSAFIYTLRRSTNWHDKPERVLTLMAAVILATLVGGVAQAVAVVGRWVVPSWMIETPPLLAFAWAVFALSFLPHLWGSMVQRLALPSMFQDRYLWQAAGKLLEWAIKREKPRNHRQPLVKSGRPTIPSIDVEPYEPPIEERTGIELFLMLAEQYGTLKRDDSNGSRGLVGKIKRDGRELSKREWEASIEWLVSNGYAELRGNGYEWMPGASAAMVLGQFEY